MQTHTLTCICLVFAQVYSHPRKNLMTFSCMGKPLPPAVVRSQYRSVLSKIESGKLSVRRRSVLATVMKDRHVFRGGTSIDDEDDKERRRYYTDLIAECKDERVQTTTTSKKTQTRKKKKSVTRVNLVGRRVIMSADEFGGSENECYHGIVIGKGRYQQRGKTKNGFKVRWHDGDEDFWCAHTHAYIRIVNVETHTYMHAVHPHIYTHTCHQVIQRTHRLFDFRRGRRRRFC